jgi:hypothetical protein
LLIIFLFYDSGANFLFGWYSWSPSFLALFDGIGLETAHVVAMQFGYRAVETTMRLCRLGQIVSLRHSELFVSSSLFRCHELLVVQQMRRLPTWRLEANLR